ncbi:M23 family metallopeptidase [Hazenella sp. IB182357]|uniref:M23 family metallopeptidase n=1 Tax=Polycladospora coralii TaxID=2771432 RepID=A0A926NFX1_9BACL|nr:M23 family metallopeptidase [Polycladospora coralii]MBD1372588.1 M23 family metallopeptidase [Polycladospora coralii]
MSTQYWRPEAQVTFYTETGEWVVRSKPPQRGQAIDAEVMAISTQTDLGQDAGVFQLVLVARNEWQQVIAANDLVRIEMKRAEGDTVFVGLVDTISEVAEFDQKPQVQVTIAGRSLAKTLLHFEIGVSNPMLAMGWLSGAGVVFTGTTAKQQVEQIFDLFLGKRYLDYTFSNGAKIGEMIQRRISSRAGVAAIMPTDESFMSYQGTLYNLLKEIAEEPFHQLFFEVYDGKPTFVFRETPFNQAPWTGLPLHRIGDQAVVSSQLARNDLETFSLFLVEWNLLKDAGLSQQPLVYEPYLKKYGIKRLHRYTNYNGESSDLLRQSMIDLYNWFVMNPNFWSGTITVQGNAHYKVGERLLYQSERDGSSFEFFIEGVQHQFVRFGEWKTVLSVTRGLPDGGKGRFAKPWGEYQSYEGGAVGDPSFMEGASAGQVGEDVSPAISGGSQKVAAYYLSPPFRISSRYGWRKGRKHKGLDLAAPQGTAIYALYDGKVSLVRFQDGGAGHYIRIKHSGGETKYFHMGERSHLKVGMKVKAGQKIGHVGNTGSSTGPHLHLEIWNHTGSMNPEPILTSLAKQSATDRRR